MKIKFSDYGRCLICCKNPCQCQDNITKCKVCGEPMGDIIGDICSEECNAKDSGYFPTGCGEASFQKLVDNLGNKRE